MKRTVPFAASAQPLKQQKVAAGVVCYNCHGPHEGRLCNIKAKICHNCGQVGHISKECVSLPGAPKARGIPMMPVAKAATEACLNCGGNHSLQLCPIPEKVCHKCRGIGHISKDCPSSRPVVVEQGGPCLNCGGPHNLKDCPVPGKVCHRCRKEGHVSKECPYQGTAGVALCLNCNGPHDLRNCPIAGKICHRCGREGHISKECSLPAQQVTSVETSTICYNCGGPHRLSQCPFPDKLCHRCGQEGHISKDCNQPATPGTPRPGQACLNCGGPHLLKSCPIAGKVCHKCGKEGHISKECRHSDVDAIRPTQTCLNCGGPHTLKECPIQGKICHRCGQEGHISKECPVPENPLSPPVVPEMLRPGQSCLNCGGPHLLKHCPIAGKVCHRCKTEGHVAKDCPSQEGATPPSGQMCLNCGGPHLLKSCPIAGKVCHKCGMEGHISKDCPVVGGRISIPGIHAPTATTATGNLATAGVACLNCGEDHLLQNCPVPTKVCHQCGGRGHISRQCPSKGLPPVIFVAHSK